MSFADFLSSALTVGTQAAGAHQQGLAQRGQRETQDLLQKIQLARQANQDAMAKRLHEAQIGNYESLAKDRMAPPEPKAPPPYIPEGAAVLGEDGKYTIPAPRRFAPRAGTSQGGTGGGPRGGPQEGRDKQRITGWATATIKAGEANPDRLVAAALAMNPGVDPQIVSAAVYEALMKIEDRKENEP